MNIEEHKENLKKYIEEDFAFREPIKNMSDFDKYCYNHCQDIKEVLNELDKKDKVIDTMAEYIEECTGSCPNDMYDWQEIDCDKECEISMKKCWIEYFYKEVEIPEEN